MIKLIPEVKKRSFKGGYLSKGTIYYEEGKYDYRIEKALTNLPFADNGIPVDIFLLGDEGEEYELWISEENIRIEASGNAGAFYAIQTLRQIFKNKEIPCLHIKDAPDFAYRGFYQDISRGKIPTVKTLKNLIEQMAYYKLNSLQLYVEHVFEFEECSDLKEKCGYISKEEIKELDAYCYDNFIEFIPSLSTFGHMYDILCQDKYKHLSCIENYEYAPPAVYWNERGYHHTINPLKLESLELIKSLLEQYYPLFTTDKFNICCDETFDLRRITMDMEVGNLYVDFVKKIIDVLKAKDKKIMMWADILLQHPECIEEISEDICFLNWNYRAEPSEENVKKLHDLKRKQIVCPGTSTWVRLCENVEVEEKNISLMVQYGYKYGAIGVLNTNWGDWGNPCSLELAMYGMVLGAAKSWSVETKIDEEFYEAVNALLYEQENAVQMLKRISEFHREVSWMSFVEHYYNYRYDRSHAQEKLVDKEKVQSIQKTYCSLAEELSVQRWKNDEYRQEMLLCIEGICVMAQLVAKMDGIEVNQIVDTKAWITRFANKWMEKNKKEELYRIEEIFLYCEEY